MTVWDKAESGQVKFDTNEIRSIGPHYGEGIKIILKSGEVFLIAMRYQQEIERATGMRVYR